VIDGRYTAPAIRPDGLVADRGCIRGPSLAGYIRGSVKAIAVPDRLVGGGNAQTLTLKVDRSAFCSAMDDALASIQVVDSEDDEAPTVDGGAGI